MCQLCSLVKVANRRQVKAAPPNTLSSWGATLPQPLRTHPGCELVSRWAEGGHVSHGRHPLAAPIAMGNN
jgi:hypothetical protein